MVKINAINTEKKYVKMTIITILILVLTLSGCSIFGGDEKKLPSADNGKGLRVSLVTGENGIEDPYYQKVWEGLEQAEKELGTVIGFVKAKSDKEYQTKLNELRNQKSDIIVTVGMQGISVVLEAAKNNPSIKYICLDSTVDQPIPANVLSVSYRVEEGAFLAGYIAGKMTKSNVIGYISGSNEDYDLRYYYGYKAGVRTANSTSELMKGLAGTYTNKSRVEKVAARMAECNADVIFHVAGTAGKGMIKAMEKPGKYAIGSYIDESSTAPDNVLTSVVINHDQLIMDIMKQAQDNKLVMGKNLSYGLADKAVSIVEPKSSLITKDLSDRLSKYQENIITGKIKIPDNENDYYKFVTN